MPSRNSKTKSEIDYQEMELLNALAAVALLGWERRRSLIQRSTETDDSQPVPRRRGRPPRLSETGITLVMPPPVAEVVNADVLSKLTTIQQSLDRIERLLAAPLATRGMTSHQELVSEGIFTVAEAATILRVSKRTVAKLMDERKLPWTRPASHRMIPRRAILDYLAERVVEAY